MDHYRANRIGPYRRLGRCWLICRESSELLLSDEEVIDILGSRKLASTARLELEE